MEKGNNSPVIKCYPCTLCPHSHGLKQRPSVKVKTCSCKGLLEAKGDGQVLKSVERERWKKIQPGHKSNFSSAADCATVLLADTDVYSHCGQTQRIKLDVIVCLHAFWRSLKLMWVLPTSSGTIRFLKKLSVVSSWFNCWIYFKSVLISKFVRLGLGLVPWYTVYLILKVLY